MKLMMTLLALVGLAACGGGAGERHASAPPAKARLNAGPVQVVSAVVWPEVHRVPATVQSKTKTAIAARILGTVARVHAGIGDRVAAGQVLVTLEARELDSTRAAAEAGAAEAQAAVPEVEGAIRAAESQLVLAESTRKRLKELFDKRSLTAQEMDEAEARVRQASAALAMAKARQTQVAARIAQARQTLETASTSAAHRTIAAPFAGVVVSRLAEPGMVAAPGVPLLEIERAGDYRLEAAVEESIAARLRVGQAFAAKIGDRELALRVDEFAPSTDVASRTVTVKANLPAGFRSGDFGRAEFRLGERPAMAIPVSAVRERGQLQMVFVVEQGIARVRMVSLGDERDGRREVLSGLREGDRVVVTPPDALEDGSPLEAK